MQLLSLFIIILSLCEWVICLRISCRNEQDSPVDWFVNYKLPKLENRKKNSLLRQGLAYAYLQGHTKNWILSRNAITSKASMMGNTLRYFYENKKDLTYLLYNDEPAGSQFGSSRGHTKGVIVFDEETGFWLIHSIPKFPPVDNYSYPSNGIENGQSILCITFNVHALNEIGKQLLYNSPEIYAKKLNGATRNKLDNEVLSLFTKKPHFVRKPPFVRVVNIETRGRLKIMNFAKDNQYNEDLYSSLIAPTLKASLNAETWRRGGGTKLGPECRLPYQVLDVQAINMAVFDRVKTVYVGFSSMEDHSKWAISQNSKIQWVCIGDTNRMKSQEKRGGGAACFASSYAWHAFNSSISELDSCELMQKMKEFTLCKASDHLTKKKGAI